MAQLNEKLSTAAKVAIGALIYSQVKKMKADIKQANDAAKRAQDELDRYQSSDKKELKAKFDTLAKKIGDIPEPEEFKLEKKQLDQIRKMIRKEVGRILFDIYKLRNTWSST